MKARFKIRKQNLSCLIGQVMLTCDPEQTISLPGSNILCRLRQYNQGHTGIGPVQITVTAKDRETPQNLPARPCAGTELFSGQHAVHPPLFPVITQLPTNRIPDGPALTTGAIAMNQGQDAIALQAGRLQFQVQPAQGLLNRGQATLKINKSLPNRSLPDNIFRSRSSTKRTRPDGVKFITAYLANHHLSAAPLTPPDLDHLGDLLKVLLQLAKMAQVRNLDHGIEQGQIIVRCFGLELDNIRIIR